MTHKQKSLSREYVMVRIHQRSLSVACKLVVARSIRVSHGRAIKGGIRSWFESKTRNFLKEENGLSHERGNPRIIKLDINMAKFIYNKVEYTLDQTPEGICLSSKGFVKSGTIREIHNRLFYAIPYSYETTDWRLVEGQDASLETFKKKIIDSDQMTYGDFKLYSSFMYSNRKASKGDVIQFRGHLFKCVRSWANVWFFSYESVWEPITKNDEFKEMCEIMDKIKGEILG